MVIGVVGTAKNTGKTTTLSYLMHHARNEGIRIGVTGIGYDGEEIDTVTFLPKPRLFVSQDTIVTTSESCLRNSTAQWNVIQRTGIHTALGEVLILKITRSGLVVIAGPNRKSTLSDVVLRMKERGLDLILVDGSLNRLTPMALAERIIFTTGASRNIDFSVLAEEMKVVERIFSYPATLHTPLAQECVRLFGKLGATDLPFFSLLDEQDATMVAGHMTPETERIVIPGLVSSKALRSLAERLGNKKLELNIADPFNLLLAGEPLELASLISFLEGRSLAITYARRPQLAAITINPFYPKPTGSSFTPAFIDKNEMMRSMRTSLRIPIFNIKDHGSRDLFAICR